MKKYLFILIMLCPLLSFSADKYALIIAIGKYPHSGGWPSISSDADVPLIVNAMEKQGFTENNINILTDANATKQRILDAFAALEKKIKKGDIVYIHYSGHGQQIYDSKTDGTADEIDGLDEALVPYDADAYLKPGIYEGENHLRDDLMGLLIAKLRNKLGKDGQLFVTLDSCHSGSMTRGGKARGGKPAMVPPNWSAPKLSADDKEKLSQEVTRGKYENVPVKSDAAPYVIISGATEDELNYEYQGTGSLSYAFSKVMENLEKGNTYRQLFAAIAANMNIIAPNQKPTIEGNVDYKLFNGETNKPNAYFDVIQVSNNNDILNINAGLINNIFEKTTVFIMPSGSLKADKTKVLATGEITKSMFGESIVKLNKPLADDNAKNYWVFIDQLSYGDIGIKLFLDPSVSDKNIINGINDFLKEKKLGEVISTKDNADVIVKNNNGKYELSPVNSDNSKFGDAIVASRGPADVLKDITNQLFNFAQGNYLKGLQLQNNDYAFEFKLIPVKYDPATKTVLDSLPEKKFYNTRGVYEVQPKKDYAILQVTNKSEKPLFISIVEINTQGEISPFFPNDNCPLNDMERRLLPGQTMTFKTCVYNFNPPFERLVLKGFASDKPLNFQSTVTTRGETRSGNNNPLDSFLQSTYNQTRGSGSTNVSSNLEGYSTEFVYDIVEEK